MSNHTTMPAALAALNAALKLALAVPTVDPIFMLDEEADAPWGPVDLYETGEDIDGANIIVACPTCKRLTEIVEISYGNLGHTQAEVDELGDGDIVIRPGEDDRDRHTLAFACHLADCQQPFNTTNINIEWM